MIRRPPSGLVQLSMRYLPFGSGAHVCQGRFFAADEMLAVTQTVLQMVDLEVLDDGGLLEYGDNGVFSDNLVVVEPSE